MGRKREFKGRELFSFDNANKKENRLFTADDPTTLHFFYGYYIMLLRYGLRKKWRSTVPKASITVRFDFSDYRLG